MRGGIHSFAQPASQIAPLVTRSRLETGKEANYRDAIMHNKLTRQPSRDSGMRDKFRLGKFPPRGGPSAPPAPPTPPTPPPTP